MRSPASASSPASARSRSSLRRGTAPRGRETRADTSATCFLHASRRRLGESARPACARRRSSTAPELTMPILKSCSALAALSLVAAAAHAGTPLYHLTPLTVPGATSVTVEDINDAGQIVGTYNDANFVRHAVLWDAAGWHELALPPGDEVNGIARAINNAGQIVGTSDDFVQPTFGLLWNAATPQTYTVLNNDSGAPVAPADINDDGVVAGGWGVPSRAFVWTEADGLVDYGVQDPIVQDQQARWTALNDSGKLIGFWNVH